jgi:hypothetical protein
MMTWGGTLLTIDSGLSLKLDGTSKPIMHYTAVHESRARVNPLKIVVHRTLIILPRCLNDILCLLPPRQRRQMLVDVP